ncbi:MAG: hypothetical protein HXS50_04195, partial [Theionarchaea archaeon]|nr:hypothetical protein [Theionarchaea archaeon]
SLAALSIEISLTRILSYLEWYHFAFMVVSIALFGYGASGTFLSVFPSIRRHDKTVTISAGLCCLALVSSLGFVAIFRFDPILAHTRPMHLLVIPLQYLTLGLPFFFTGTCLASLVTRRPESANTFYFYDLTGAGLGSILALSIIPLGGPHIAVFVSASTAAMAFFMLSDGIGNLRFIALPGAFVLLILPLAMPTYEPEISEYKGLSSVLRFPDAEIVWSGWNSISRVDVVNNSFFHYAPGMPFDEKRPIPAQMGLLVDGDNLEPITRFDGDPAGLGFMESLPTSISYLLRPRNRVLILDAGGGFEVLQAIALGAEEIDATEKNPSIIRLMKREFDSFSGGLYTQAGVELHGIDARSFLAGSEGQYDLVEVSLKQDPVTASTGLYSLSESYLYTVEGFSAAFSRLADDGVLSVTRWVTPPPRQAPRTWALMVEMLEAGGAKPDLHLVSFRTYLTITTLVKKTPFEENELETMREICRERRFDLVYYPGMAEEEANRYNIFETPFYYTAFQQILDPATRDSFLENSFFRLDVTTDDRPFFSDFLKLGGIPDLRRSLGKVWNPYLEGGLLVLAVLVQAVVLSVAFILTPLIMKRSEQKVRGKVRWVSYFVCLGAAYILIEVTLMQKFILFLGQPAFAMAAILSGMLMFSGAGSLWSTRFDPGRRPIMRAVLAVIVMTGILYLFLPLLFDSLLGAHIWIKFAVSIIVIAPPALAMGVPFPVGLRSLGLENSEVIPLAYAGNGCSSVIGSAATVIVASWVGFSNVLLLGVLAYMLSVAVLPRS